MKWVLDLLWWIDRRLFGHRWNAFCHMLNHSSDDDISDAIDDHCKDPNCNLHNPGWKPKP